MIRKIQNGILKAVFGLNYKSNSSYMISTDAAKKKQLFDYKNTRMILFLLLQMFLTISMIRLLGKMKLKKQQQWLQEIDGEEKGLVKNQEKKYFQKICQLQDQQVAVKQKLVEEWLNQSMHLLQRQKQPSIQKLVTLVKMQSASLKIRTSLRLNLAKVGYDLCKKRHNEIMRKKSLDIQKQVYDKIAGYMIGEGQLQQGLRQKKIQDLNEGRYKGSNIMMTPLDCKFVPGDIPSSYTIEQVISTIQETEEQKKKQAFNSLDLNKYAVKLVENEGIVFIDQIDKIAISQSFSVGKSVSRQGVQRDLLPLLQGTVINTKFGDIHTEQILFIASGAFSMCTPEDLFPQLLGRLPLKVGMKPLTYQEIKLILTKPKYNLINQQILLLSRENVQLVFEPEAIQRIASATCQLNLNLQNLGARRIQSTVEKIVEQISFNASEYAGKKFVITPEYVNMKLQKMLAKVQLSSTLI